MYYQKNTPWTKAKSTEYKGIRYDSKFEAGYAAELDLKVRGKLIKSWERQVKIPLDVNGYHIANYFIDFVVHHNDGTIEYVECKGVAFELWRLKWKLFEALYADKPDVKLTVIKQTNNFKIPKAKKIKK